MPILDIPPNFGCIEISNPFAENSALYKNRVSNFHAEIDSLLKETPPTELLALESLSTENLKSEYELLKTIPGAICMAENLNKLP